MIPGPIQHGDGGQDGDALYRQTSHWFPESDEDDETDEDGDSDPNP